MVVEHRQQATKVDIIIIIIIIGRSSSVTITQSPTLVKTHLTQTHNIQRVNDW